MYTRVVLYMGRVILVLFDLHYGVWHTKRGINMEEYTCDTYICDNGCAL